MKRHVKVAFTLSYPGGVPIPDIQERVEQALDAFVKSKRLQVGGVQPKVEAAQFAVELKGPTKPETLPSLGFEDEGVSIMNCKED